MTKHLSEVRKWTETFGHLISPSPVIPDNTIQKLRINLLLEEVKELSEAMTTGNLVEAADAIADIQFVLDGAVLALGLQKHMEHMCSEVYRSNMSKLGADGKVIYREDGKVLKSDRWSPPNLTFVLEETK